MTRRNVRDLEAGETLYGCYAVTSKALRAFRDPAKGRYLTLTLADATGSLQAKVWDQGERVAATFAEGDVVEVEGRLEEWDGSLQATLTSLRPLAPDEIDPSEFLPWSPRDPERCWTEVRKVVEDEVDCPYLKQLLLRFLEGEDTRPLLLRGPAAKGRHHAYLGGLIEHVACSVLIARSVCRVHKGLDRSLVHAGIILHDIGKIRELTATTRIDYVPQGRLIGHIVLGYEWVTREANAIEGFPEETLLLLGHIILSHHGRAEFGAPVVPMTPEAEVVHMIENLDAQVNHTLSVVREAREKGQEYSEYDRLLGRYFYAGRRPEPPADEPLGE